MAQADLLKMLELIRPRTATREKIRLGDRSDGGYVISDDLQGVDAVVSIGIGSNMSFDLAAAELGLTVFQYDQNAPTDTRATHDRMIFTLSPWADTNQRGTDLATMTERAGHELILKFDVEGAEWDILQTVSVETLSRYRIIVGEFHYMTHAPDRGFLKRAINCFRKLAENHVPVHLHPNNYGPFSIVEGIPIPDTIEVTWLRNDRATFIDKSHPIPSVHDFPNCPGVPDYVMTAFAEHNNYVPTVSHSGDVGDFIYSLPLVRALAKHAGECDLVLYPSQATRRLMSEELVEELRPLLELQPYIRSARFSPHPQGTVLDGWRYGPYIPGYAICDRHLDLSISYQSYSKEERNTPWINVDSVYVADVVIHRSPRHHNDEMPWKSILSKYAGRAVFVGSREEYDHIRSFGDLPYHPTSDYLELAKVIAGASLFIGNQSSPLALAIAMFQNSVVERCEYPDNCYLDRGNLLYISKGDERLPELDVRSPQAAPQ